MKKLTALIIDNLLLLFLFIIFVLEGSGLKYGREASYFLILLMPFCLICKDIMAGKTLALPKRLTKLFIFLFIFLIISTFFSTDIQNSFERLLFYMSVFFTFIYAINDQTDLNKKMESLLILLGIFFSCYILVIGQFKYIDIHPIWNFVKSGQFIHNNFGDFLGLVLVIMFERWLKTNKNSLLFFLLPLLYFFLTSYSRTAYLSFAIVTLFILLKGLRINPKKILLFSSLIIFFTLFFYVFSIFNLHKTLVSDRNQYFSWAIQATKDRPLTGVGLGNYLNASIKYSDSPYYTSISSSNIFLDFFAESGILGGIMFIWIIIYLFKKIKLRPSILYLLLAFQTYWFFLYYSVLLLFFIFLGVNLQKDVSWNISAKKFIIIPTLIAFIALLILLSKVYDKKLDYVNANRLYPLDKMTLINLSEQMFKQNKSEEAFKYISQLEHIAPNSPNYQVLAANSLLRNNHPKEALYLLKQAYNWDPFTQDFDGYRLVKGRKLIARNIYELEKDINGEDKAKNFFDSFVKKFIEKDRKQFNDSFILGEVRVMCQAIYFGNCPYEL